MTGRDRAIRDLKWGLIWLIGGGVVTFATYSAAGTGAGGTYFLFYGAIIYGAYRLLRGVWGIITTGSDPAMPDVYFASRHLDQSRDAFADTEPPVDLAATAIGDAGRVLGYLRLLHAHSRFADEADEANRRATGRPPSAAISATPSTLRAVRAWINGDRASASDAFREARAVFLLAEERRPQMLQMLQEVWRNAADPERAEVMRQALAAQADELRES